MKYEYLKFQLLPKIPMVKNGRGPLLAPRWFQPTKNSCIVFIVHKLLGLVYDLASEAQNLEIRIFAQNSHGQKRAWPIPTTSDTDRLVDFFL